MNIFKRFIARFAQRTRFIFGRSEQAVTGSTRQNEIIGGIANAIAANVGKLAPQVIRRDASGKTVIRDDRLSRLLTLRPCPEASTYDFLYRMGAELVYNSNAFAVIFYTSDYTEIERIQPITVRSHSLFEDDRGNIFLRFVWDYDGNEYTVPYEFVIHLKARYNRRRFLGTSPDVDLQRSVDLLETTYEGIKRAVKNSANLRGYLQYNNIADEDDLRKKVNEFRDAYFNAENEGGIAGLDNSFEFKEINQQPRQIPTQQVSFFRDNIYRYYGVNEKILTGAYTETEWNSFYESVIEPIAIQLSLEFTFKVFTERERGFGNKIVFAANRLQYASLQTRATIGKDYFDRGAITINEYRELIYLPAIEGGDIRMISLNYVKTTDQSAYQTGKDDGGEGDSDNKSVIKIRSRIEEVCSNAEKQN